MVWYKNESFSFYRSHKTGTENTNFPDMESFHGNFYKYMILYNPSSSGGLLF